MSIQIGIAYKFLFSQTRGFDPLNGIYTVTHAIDYNSILDDDINLLEFLYKRVNKSQTDLNTDIPNIKNETFYRLVQVDSKDEIYIPRLFIVGIPDPDVQEYSKLMLAVDLGPFADPALLSSITASVDQSLQQVVGVTVTADIMEYDQQWLTGTDYQNIVDSRNAAKGGAINYHKLFLDQQVVNLQQAARITALEQLVAALDAAP